MEKFELFYDNDTVENWLMKQIDEKKLDRIEVIDLNLISLLEYEFQKHNIEDFVLSIVEGDDKYRVIANAMTTAIMLHGLTDVSTYTLSDIVSDTCLILSIAIDDLEDDKAYKIIDSLVNVLKKSKEVLEDYGLLPMGINRYLYEDFDAEFTVPVFCGRLVDNVLVAVPLLDEDEG